MLPFFTFYGGKYRSSTKYPAPRYSTIIEPFAGSAGYAVRYGAGKRVLLADLDEYICGVWDYLIGSSPRDILSLPNIPNHCTVDDFQICQEARWLIGFWLNKGSSYPKSVPSAWMRKGTHTNSFWGDAIKRRIAGQLEGIRRWRVFHSPASDLPYSGSATWFIDPPYIGQPGNLYRYNNDAIDYSDLARWCRSRRGQTIVCEGPNATWLPFSFLAQIKTTEGRYQNAKSDEYIWTNEEPVARDYEWLT